jgi:hypothetical protein
MSATPRRIHVLTSCTGSKVSLPRSVPAEDLYSGQHHVRLMRGVSEARAEGLEVDLSIVSAGHGIVAGSDPLAPYERTCQGRSTDDRRKMARALAIPDDVRGVLRRPTDLHVVLLGEDYLEACELADDVRPSAPVLIVCAVGTALGMPPIPGLDSIALSTDDTRRFHCGLVGLKGEVGGRLLAYIARDKPSIDDLTDHSLLDNLVAVRARADVAASSLF